MLRIMTKWPHKLLEKTRMNRSIKLFILIFAFSNCTPSLFKEEDNVRLRYSLTVNDDYEVLFHDYINYPGKLERAFRNTHFCEYKNDSIYWHMLTYYDYTHNQYAPVDSLQDLFYQPIAYQKKGDGLYLECYSKGEKISILQYPFKPDTIKYYQHQFMDEFSKEPFMRPYLIYKGEDTIVYTDSRKFHCNKYYQAFNVNNLASANIYFIDKDTGIPIIEIYSLKYKYGYIKYQLSLYKIEPIN